MKKRVIAWVILIGFLLLLLNIIVFRFYWQLSMVIYILIAFAFVFSNGKLFKPQDSAGYENLVNPEEPEGSESETEQLHEMDNKSNSEDKQ